MAQIVNFEGKSFSFPDDASDDEIGNALAEATKPPSTSEVAKAIPGEALRHIVGAASGVATALSDVGITSSKSASEAAGVRRELQAERRAEVPENMTTAQEGLFSAGTSVLGQVPATVAAAVAAPFVGSGAAVPILAGATTTSMGLTTGFERYGELKDAGFGPLRSGLHGAFEGLVEKYTEYIPMREFGFIKNKLVGSLTKYLGKEMAGEQVATALQDLSAKLSDRPDMTLGDYLHDAAVTAIATAVAAPVQAGVIRTLGAVMGPFIKPENLSVDDMVKLREAAEVAGVPPAQMGLTQDGLPQTPGIGELGAVEQAPPPLVDLSTLAGPSKITPAGEGLVRVYTVLPEGQTPEQVVWTQDLGAAQQLVNVMGPKSRVAYLDMEHGELAMSQQPDAVQEQRQELRVADSEFLLPASFAQGGNWVYNPPQTVPQTPPVAPPPEAPQRRPAAKPEQTYFYQVDPNDKKKKVRLEFADPMAKQLFVYAQRADNRGTYATEEELSGARVELAHHYQIPAEWVGPLAKMYRDEIAGVAQGLVKMTNPVLRPPAPNLTEMKAELDRHDLPEMKLRRQLVKEAKAGELYVNPTIKTTPHVKRLTAFLQKWLTMFAPNTRLVVDAVAEAGGSASFRVVEGTGVITLPTGNMGAFWSLFSTSHEFGHHLYWSRLMQPEHAQARAELQQEWRELKADVPNITAGEFVDRWMSPGKTSVKQQLLDHLGVRNDAPAIVLVEAINEGRSDNAMSILTFEEYAAEQFAIYTGKNYRTTLGGEVKRFFRDAVRDLKNFFDEVAKKFLRAAQPQPRFERWVDGLRLVPQGEDTAEVNDLAARELSNTVFYDLVDLQYQYTLRLINRLPKKDKIQRITIVGELSRADVKDQERRLVQGVLDQFDGDVIDKKLFVQKLQDTLVPLTLTETRSYATYGLSRIGVGLGETPSARTTLFQLPFEVSDSNHFQDKNYFGHLRSYVDVAGVERIVEVQSDLAQKEVVQDQTKLEEKLQKAEQHVENYRGWQQETRDTLRQMADPAYLAATNEFGGNELGHLVYVYEVGLTQSYVRELIDVGVVNNFAPRTTWADPGAYRLVARLKEHLVNQLEFFEEQITDWSLTAQRLREQISANVPARLEMLPKRWWEFMLRRYNADMAERGVKRAAIGTADTVAKVEGWSYQDEDENSLEPVDRTLATQLQALKLEGVQLHDLFKASPSLQATAERMVQDNIAVYVGEYKLEHVYEGSGPGSPALASVWRSVRGDTVFEDVDMVEVIKGVEAFNKLPTDPMQWQQTSRERNINPRFQGLYNRYKNEITKFVKREFGAKEVTAKERHETLLQQMERLSEEHELTFVEDGGFWHVTDDRNAIVPNHLQPIEVRRLLVELRQTDGASPTLEAGRNLTWLEWDVKPELKDVPVEYYDVLDTAIQAGEKTQATLKEVAGEDIPDVPKYFSRFQGFFQLGLQLNQLSKLLPTVEPLQRYRRLVQAMANLKNQLMAGPNDRIKQWYALSKKDSLGVMQMLRDEVREGHHWTALTKHQITVGGKVMDVWTHEVTPEVWEKAKEREVSEQGVEVYMGVKRDFASTLGTMEQTLLNAIKEFFVKNPAVGNMRTAAVLNQFQKFRETPWVPDQRFGQWHVLVRTTKDTVVDGEKVEAGTVVYRAGHRRKGQMQKEVARLQKEYGSDFKVLGTYLEDSVYVLRGLPREFIHQLPEVLQLDEAQMDKFREMYFDVTMEGKFYKHFSKEKRHIPGAEQDMRQSYSDYMWRAANMIGKLAYGYKLNGQILELNKVVGRAHGQGASAIELERLHEYLTKHFNYIMTPQHEWEQLRAFVSLWYLWGVPKTALMNSTTLLTTTYPYLASRFGDAAAVRAQVRAMKDVAAFWRDPSKVDKETVALFAHGRADGVLQQSFAAELAAVADGNAIERIMPQYAFLRDSGARDRVRKATWKIIHWGMIPFRAVEEFNRMTTILAAYRLNKANGLAGLSQSTGEGTAYMAARDAVDFTQNEYAPWNRAAFLRGKKSVALIFYSFMQHMTFFLFGGDRGWWRGLLMLAALGGVQGLPGAENVFDFLDWLGRIALGKPVQLRKDAREMAMLVGLNPDFIMHGAFHSNFGLGWDTSGSVGLGRIIPGTDAIFGQGDANQRIVQMAGEVGGPFGSMTISLMQALMDDNPNMLLRMERAFPPLARSLTRAYRGAAEDRWTDTRGRTVIDEVTGLEVLGQIAGFSPTIKSRAQEARHFQREAAEFYVLRRTNLLTAYFQAYQARDPEAVADARSAIARYNAQVPDNQLRITADEMKQSVKARERTQREIQTGVSASQRYRPVYERVLDAFPNLHER